MNNETLLLLMALIDICFVFLAARLRPRFLFGTIALNLILITIFGAKLITVFGLTTNIGNIFYGCVFLAAHFLLERHHYKEVMQALPFGVAAVTVFLFLSQTAVYVSSAVPGDAFDEGLRTVFALSPRIALASVVAYIFAQYANIRLYCWIKERTDGRALWLQSNGANIIGQLIDSCIFFAIAFIDLPGTALVQAILTGWLIKTVVVLLGTPFLYIDQYLLRHSVHK